MTHILDMTEPELRRWRNLSCAALLVCYGPLYLWMFLSWWTWFASTAMGEPLDVGGWRASREYKPVVRMASETATAQQRDRVVRITTVGDNGSQYKGVGTFIQWGNEPGLIVTVAHLFRDAKPRATVCIDQVGCTFGQLVGISHEDDLAIVKVDRLDPGSYSTAVIAEQPPEVGETLRSYRYGSEPSLVCTSKLLKYVSFGGYRRTSQGLDHMIHESVPGSVLEISSASAGGDSGGPIINAKNELVGIIACGDARSTNGSCCTRIRALLQRCCPGGRRQPAVQPVYPGPGGGVLIGPWATEPSPGPPQPSHPGPMIPVEPIRGGQGDKGEPGEQGIPGEPGTSPTLDDVVDAIIARLRTDQAFLVVVAGLVEPVTIDPADLAAKIQPHLDPIHVKVEVLDEPPENEIPEEDVYLGGTLPLRLFLKPRQPK